MEVTAQATFATTLVDEWVRSGLRHAVVAPGSRSTPLALALADDDRLTVHVQLDERSAGYVALGLALAGGRPAVVLTSSGTAAVELHPAVVEASQSAVPMIVCTADRPFELKGVGAPQTIDQTHLYGAYVRWFAEPGTADEAVAGTWRSFASRAVAEAMGPPAGPVHLNLAFRDPLVGRPGPLPEGRPDGRPWHAVAGPAPAASEGDDDGGAAALLRAARGVVVAGRGADRRWIAPLAEAFGWPVLADPRSSCRVPDERTVAAADAILRVPAFADAHRPDAVLRVGEPPASKVVAQWLAAAGVSQVVLDPDGAWPDPDRTAGLLLRGRPEAWCRRLAAGPRGPADPAWLASWAAAEGAAQQALEATLAGHAEVTEPGVARRLVAALPDGATLVCSSSMPVRDVEWYGAPRHGLTVVSNRGANGIDGVVSTAVGVAIAAEGPTALLIGDLAYLHDTNGLLGLAGRDLDLTIVVVDNRGGGIFSFLPQATTLPVDRFEQLFGTPQDVDLAGLAAAHGLPVLEAHDMEGLDVALARHPHHARDAGRAGPHGAHHERGRARRAARRRGDGPALPGFLADRLLVVLDVPGLTPADELRHGDQEPDDRGRPHACCSLPRR